MKKQEEKISWGQRLFSHTKLNITLACIGIFLLCLSLLIFTPKAVDLTETQILTSFNQPWEKPKYLIPEAVGAERKPVTEIIDKQIAPPQFSAGAVLAQDLETGKILYAKNINQRLSPASTTKIMTALVAEDYFQPDDVLTVSSASAVGGSSMDLHVGEKLTFRSLLYGMMLNSGNDAAFTIAVNYPGGLGAFVEKMNEKVTSLGLSNTHFQNPAGFDAVGHYSSAYDLAKIATLVTKSPTLSRVVSTKETSITSVDQNKSHYLKNLNQLLGENGVIGIKTGFTELAGENLVGLVERDGHKVLTVVLSSNDRFGETKNLMDWIYNNYSWTQK